MIAHNSERPLQRSQPHLSPGDAAGHLALHLQQSSQRELTRPHPPRPLRDEPHPMLQGSQLADGAPQAIEDGLPGDTASRRDLPEGEIVVVIHPEHLALAPRQKPGVRVEEAHHCRPAVEPVPQAGATPAVQRSL